jgi:GT2 family glycosyltransferase
MKSMATWDDYPIPANLPPVVVRNRALPLISVVTPSFNQGRFIGRTIASVLGQSYPNIEHWVIDGGSSDETLDVLRQYEGDPRFHWLSERDSGQADAVNKGWRRCQGALLGWLNSDDTYLPGALARLAAALAADPGADVAYGDAVMVTEDDEVIRPITGRPLDLEALFRRNYISQPAALQRRAAIEHCGPLSPGRTFALDYEFYLKVALSGRIVYAPGPCATYRVHTGSKTTTGAGRFTRDMYEAVAQLLARSDLPQAVAAQRAAIHSEWYTRMGASYAQEGAHREALRAMLLALRHAPRRPQTWLIPLMILDVASGLRLSARRFSVGDWPRTGQRLEDYLRRLDQG